MVKRTGQKKELYIFGAGEHAKVCMDISLLLGYKVLGVVRHGKKGGGTFQGIPLIGDEDSKRTKSLISKRNANYFVAIGDSRIRERVTNEVYSLTEKNPINLIHPDVFFSELATIGCGNFVNCGAKINAGARIGDHTIIEANAVVSSSCVIHDYVRIAPGVNLASLVTLKKGAFLGIGSNIILGITIGEWAIVGAGAVVIRDIPPGVTAVGVPAEVIKKKKGAP